MCRVKLDIFVKRIQYSLTAKSCLEISYFFSNECESLRRFFGVCTYCPQFCVLYDTASEVTVHELNTRKVIMKQASKTIYFYVINT